MNDALQAVLARQDVLADGAYSTNLRAHCPSGTPVETLNLDAAALVLALARDFVDAGADLLWTNTFGITLPSLRQDARRVDLLKAGVAIAREAAGDRVPVVASLAPAGADAGDLVVLYRPLAEAAISAGACAVALETATNAEDAATVVAALKRAGIEVMVTFTIMRHTDGAWYTHCGTPLADAAQAVLAAGACATGINCSDGPAAVLAGINALRAARVSPLIARPNAGVAHAMPPEEFALWATRLREAGAWCVGGCCGTRPDHIAALRR